MKIHVRDEVTRVVSKMPPAFERLLRHQTEREAIVFRTHQLVRSGVGHLHSLDQVMHEFDIMSRTEKERAAYRRFINVTLMRDPRRCELVR